MLKYNLQQFKTNLEEITSKLFKEEEEKIVGKNGSFERTCPICNRQFRTNRTDKIYCCENHSQIASNQKRSERRRKDKNIPEIRTCIVCGKIFKPKRENSLCCSTSCRKKAHNTLLIQEIMEEQEMEKKELKKKLELLKMKNRVMKYIKNSKDLRCLSSKSEIGLPILESIQMGLYGITNKIVEKCYNALQQME